MPNKTAIKLARIDTVDEAERDMQELARLQRQIDEITAKRDRDLASHKIALELHQSKIDEITAEAATELKLPQEQYQLIEARLESAAKAAGRWRRWAGAAKKLTFATGGYITRQRSKSRRIKVSKKMDEIFADMEAKGLSHYISYNPKLKKRELLGHPEDVDKIDGLDIVQDIVVKVHPLG